MQETEHPRFEKRERSVNQHARRTIPSVERRPEKEPIAFMQYLRGIRDRFREVIIAHETSVPTLTTRMREELEHAEKEMVRDGVNFSRCQMDQVVADYNAGKRVEFESFSPYLADYNMKTGEIWEDRLAPMDAIGLEVAKVLRKSFPKSRMVSLYDEYNSGLPESSDAFGKPVPEGPQIEFSPEAKEKFRTGIEEVLKKNNVIDEKDKEGEQFLFIAESEKTKDAEELVRRLEAAGYIKREGSAVYFSNPDAENPLYRKIILRTKHGRWLCEALDASTYLKTENIEITHLVILPENFKVQQDKVWEMLRVVGIKPLNYHNIFYDEKRPPEQVAKTIKNEILKYLN